MILDDGFYITAREVSSHSPDKCHTINVTNDINEAHLFRRTSIKEAKAELNMKYSNDWKDLNPVAMLQAEVEIVRTVRLKT
ncbi:MAG: hypothetical protein KUG81_04175 [Gammaproteobacteria bacterium]|nr:hypothetical protein [Gammaproteobacteria bacterium]